MKHILTLCAGNICRSPIAGALLAREFPDKAVWSAGLGTPAGDPADPYRKPKAAFEATYADIARGVAGWVPHIQKI